MLWVVGSLEITCSVWPTLMPRTCGLYMQPFWSSVTGSVGAATLYFSAPSFTYTKTLGRVPFEFTSPSSTWTAELCLPTQTGSWSIWIVARFGLVPWKETLPVTEPTVAWSMGVGGASVVSAGCSETSPSFFPQPTSQNKLAAVNNAKILCFVILRTFLEMRFVLCGSGFETRPYIEVVVLAMRRVLKPAPTANDPSA